MMNSTLMDFLSCLFRQPRSFDQASQSNPHLPNLEALWQVALGKPVALVAAKTLCLLVFLTLVLKRRRQLSETMRQSVPPLTTLGRSLMSFVRLLKDNLHATCPTRTQTMLTWKFRQLAGLDQEAPFAVPLELRVHLPLLPPLDLPPVWIRPSSLTYQVVTPLLTHAEPSYHPAVGSKLKEWQEKMVHAQQEALS